MARKIDFQCKKLKENEKKSTSQGQTEESKLEFIHQVLGKELTFRLSVTGHPEEVKNFQNDVGIQDVDEFFESTFKIIPKIRQSKLLETVRPPKPTGDVDDEDKIDLDEEEDDNEDLID